ASSSATRICPDGIAISSFAPTLGRSSRRRTRRAQRHQHAEHCPARMRFALNDASVVANQLGHQCKTQTRALRFRRHERIEQIAKYLGRDARAVIPNADLERQPDRFGAWRRAQAHAWAIRRRERYLALDA